MRRAIIPAIVFLVLVGFFLRGLTLDPRRVPSPFVGKPAPEFSLPSLADPERVVSSEGWAGRPVLLNVWATWCAGCYDEHAYLVTLSRSSGVPIYGLNWKDEREKAKAWLARLGNPYAAVGFDADGREAIDWGVYGAPETFLIGADGTVLHKHLGPMTQAAWEKDFLPLIDATGAEG